MIGAACTFATGDGGGPQPVLHRRGRRHAPRRRDQRADLRGRATGDELADRQPRLARVLLLPPPPGPRRQPCEHASSSSTASRCTRSAPPFPDDGAALDHPRRRSLRAVHREDDRGAEHARRLRVAARGGTSYGAARPRLSATPSTTNSGSGSTTTPRTFPAADRTSTRLVDYGGSLEQALRDLIEWVEHGTGPPADTGYTLTTRSSALTLAATAAERGGVQPVVTLRANGASAPTSRVGEPVTLRSGGRRPPGAARSSGSSGTSTAPARGRSSTTRSTARTQASSSPRQHAFDVAGCLLSVRTRHRAPRR